MRQVILDEDEMILKRELVYDLIKFMSNLSYSYDIKMEKYVFSKGYTYESLKEFDEVLAKLNDEDLERLLLIVSP